MTYLAFLAIFVVPPIVLLGVALGRRGGRLGLADLLIVASLALAYTTPWDDQIIREGVWRYPSGRVLGVNVGRVPIEECAFYVLQVGLVGTLWRWWSAHWVRER